mmetsp:Transcript_48393/g.89754  ORF Transcript_48393/g.89754 Transcript_48393/m.89754 type:complete len:134 (+) Transcript_48393:1080-1481(+)
MLASAQGAMRLVLSSLALLALAPALASVVLLPLWTIASPVRPETAAAENAEAELQLRSLRLDTSLTWGRPGKSPGMGPGLQTGQSLTCSLAVTAGRARARIGALRQRVMWPIVSSMIHALALALGLALLAMLH